MRIERVARSIVFAGLVAALLGATAQALASPAAPAPAAAPQAVQYVQVQYRNVLLDHGLPKMGSNMLGSALQSAAHQFISQLISTALTHANPVLGFIAQQIAAKAQAKLLSAPSHAFHMDPKINVRAEFQAMTTVSPDRTRTDIGAISTIVQCDARRVIVLDTADKTYTVTSFDEAAQEQDHSTQLTSGFAFFTAAMGGGDPGDSAVTTAMPQPDDGAVTIAGLTARHSIFTVSANGGASGAKTDLWYADLPIADRCASDSQNQEGGPSATSSGDPTRVRVPLRSMEWTEMSLGSDASPAPAASIAPASYVDPMLSRPGFAWLETTSVVQLPYDPAFFDVPPGYTMVAPSPAPAAQPSNAAQPAPSPALR